MSAQERSLIEKHWPGLTAPETTGWDADPPTVYRPVDGAARHIIHRGVFYLRHVGTSGRIRKRAHDRRAQHGTIKTDDGARHIFSDKDLGGSVLLPWAVALRLFVLLLRGEAESATKAGDRTRRQKISWSCGWTPREKQKEWVKIAQSGNEDALQQVEREAWARAHLDGVEFSQLAPEQRKQWLFDTASDLGLVTNSPSSASGPSNEVP